MRTVVLSATRPGVLGASVRLACPLALVLAVACSSSSTPPAGSALSPDAVRFLEQSTFGPTEALAASLQDAGFAGFVDAQFAASASSLGTYPVVLQPPAVVCPLSAPSNCYRDNFTAFQPAVQFFHNALAGEDQLRQRVAFALSQIFVVSDGEVNSTYGMADYEQLLSNDAFSNFRQILQDVTLSPAMGRYLNMVNNDKANPTAGTHPNENYARELLQLFSIGLVKLNADGTVVTDSNGQPLPTYDQSVVDGFAAVFTGWTYPTVPGATQKPHNPTNYRGVMEAVQSNHDVTLKTLLEGATLPAGQSAAQDLAGALDLLFNHPNVGPFIGKQLIQFLVTSNPSPGYVSRVSAAFADNGSGVRGRPAGGGEGHPPRLRGARLRPVRNGLREASRAGAPGRQPRPGFGSPERRRVPPKRKLRHGAARLRGRKRLQLLPTQLPAERNDTGQPPVDAPGHGQRPRPVEFRLRPALRRHRPGPHHPRSDRHQRSVDEPDDVGR